MTLLRSALPEFLGSLAASLVLAAASRALHGLRKRRRRTADDESAPDQPSATPTTGQPSGSR
ncbi:hypothetical protein ACIHAA_27130 [Streptomyces sp. NPDC052040]|uniref:hypothetical protein n=1 Tax=unclassified Streptomyces TaxID=2593676 RepID=UPI0037CE3C8B